MSNPNFARRLDDRGGVPRIVLVGVALVVLVAATVGYFILAGRREGELARYHFEMQSSLRDLGARQDAYFARHEQFASDACADGARCETLGVTAAAGITLRARGTENGWAAVATHADLPDESCDIHVGEVPSPGVSTVPGQVACTAFWP